MRTSASELLASSPQLSVGILTADLRQLGAELASLESTGVRIVHLDVMDGVFCPQLTAGPPLLRALPKSFVRDVHLMVEEPLTKVGDYVDAGADVLTFHVEASRHPHRVLQSLAGTGVVRGVALNPGTPVETIEPLLDAVELVLVLAVNPGWSGQTFDGATAARVERARELVAGRDVVVAVDGGVTRANAAAAGRMADLVVAGSAIFDGGCPADNARAMLASVHAGRVDRACGLA